MTRVGSEHGVERSYVRSNTHEHRKASAGKSGMLTVAALSGASIPLTPDERSALACDSALLPHEAAAITGGHLLGDDARALVAKARAATIRADGRRAVDAGRAAFELDRLRVRSLTYPHGD